MKNKYINFIVLCEGYSENAYISELSRFLTRNESKITLHPKIIGNGQYTVVRRAIKKLQKENPREKFVVWLDFDIYKRNIKECTAYQNNTKYKDFIKFSNMNFEDFLTLHLPQNELLKWEGICISKNHFKVPLHSEDYIPLFKDNIFCDYEKGELPFAIDNKVMLNFMTNYTSLKTNMHCSFADWLVNDVFKGIKIFSSFLDKITPSTETAQT